MMKFSILTASLLLVSCKTTVTNGNLSEAPAAESSLHVDLRQDSGESVVRRLRIDKIEKRANIVEGLRLEVREYDFSRPLNPYGAATYEPSTSYVMTITCTDLSGLNVSTVSMRWNSITTILSDADMTFKVGDCARLLRYLEQNKDKALDMILDPTSSKKLVVLPAKE